ncbi:MAG: HD domain-containing protein [Verrucomicrobiota bacterium]
MDAHQNSEMVETARAFAIAAHGHQKYGERPYVHHLDAVALLLAPYGEQAQVIGYLHDVVEDTTVSEADVRARFGGHVASCVSLLTDEAGATRKEKKARTYAKLALVTGSTELALIVKVADRLANVRACVADGNRAMWETYLNEQPSFKSAAYRAGLCESLWSELDIHLSAKAPSI